MNTLVQSALLGATTGIRSTSGTFAARWAESNRLPVGPAMALGGEMVADKLPFVPARTTPGGLAPRLGGAIYAVKTVVKRPNAVAYGVAALAAIATAFAATRARKAITENTNIPDIVVGLAEDAIVAGLTWAAVRAI